MMRYVLFGLALVGLAPAAHAVSAGLELQVYPTGYIADVRVAAYEEGRNACSIYAGYNLTDRRGNGKRDDESGGGPGIGVGGRRYETARQTGKMYGLRFDVWSLEIDWREKAVEGTSDVIVLQPTLEAGYAWRFMEERLRVETAVSIGVEWNAKTDGPSVGEGPIGLFGVSAVYKF